MSESTSIRSTVTDLWQALAGAQHDRMLSGIDRGHRLAQAQVYPGRVVIALFMDEQLVRPRFAPQVLLGQGRPLVGPLPLFTDQG